MALDPSSFLGPVGGLIAIAYGAGAASGYAFCLRTMYKILKSQSEKDEKKCEDEVEEYKKKNAELERECKALNERLIFGIEHQREATHNAGMYLLGKMEDKK